MDLKNKNMGAPKGNKNASGNEGGRPPIHTDPEALQKLIQDYFEWIKGDFTMVEVTLKNDDGEEYKESKQHWTRKPEPPTVTGLAIHTGFADKSSLYDYKEKVEFSHCIKKGLTLIEKHHEIQCAYGEKCTGNIFVLKNFGWKDRTEHEVKGDISVIWKETKQYDSDQEAD